MTTRVIGLGSPFGDDRAGWRVIERLRGRVPPGADLQALDRPGAALVTWLDGVDWLILVDAVDDPPARGSYGRVDTAQLAMSGRPVTSHALRLDETLALAAALGTLPERIDLYGIAIDPCSGPELSPAVDAATATLADDLQRCLAARPAAPG